MKRPCYKKLTPLFNFCIFVETLQLSLLSNQSGICHVLISKRNISQLGQSGSKHLIKSATITPINLIDFECSCYPLEYLSFVFRLFDVLKLTNYLRKIYVYHGGGTRVTQ